LRITFKGLILFIICVILGVFIRSYIAKGNSQQTVAAPDNQMISAYTKPHKTQQWESVLDPQLKRRDQQIEAARIAEAQRLAAIKAREESEALQRAEAAKASNVPTAPQKPIQTAINGSDLGVWERLALCESGGRWDYNGSSGFDGGIQFLPSTWNAMNTGYAFAWQAPKEVQIAAGMRLQARSGWGQWPACARKLGLL
jgi:hypothetical protein